MGENSISELQNCQFLFAMDVGVNWVRMKEQVVKVWNGGMAENREKFNKTEYNIPSKIPKNSLLIKKKNLFLFEVPSMCTVEPVNTTTVKVWKIGCTQG